MNKTKLLIVTLILIAGIGYITLDLEQYLTLDYAQSQLSSIQEYKDENFAQTAIIYFVGYVVATSLSIPGAIMITLLGGAIFGLFWGTLLVSFASSIGATMAFLASRYLLRDWVESKFGNHLARLNKGIERDGSFYLFSIRMVPLFPFFVVNLLMGLTAIRTSSFYVASQLGMFIGTVVYINAGSELSQISSLSGLVSAPVLFSLVLLGIFPLIAKLIINAVQRNKGLKKFSKPKRFDANVVVIGAGSAGLVASLITAGAKAKVILVEKHKMGGDCLNTGCVPSKALIRSSRIAHYYQRAEEFGLQAESAKADFSAVMARVQSAIKRIEPHDSVERYEGMGVNCVSGDARLVSPWEVEVNGERLSARNIVLASGGRPRIPDWPGISEVNTVTSDTLWELKELPSTLLVAGGGPIGCELAQAFARLGSQVTVLARSGLMPKEDEDARKLVEVAFERDGIRVIKGFDVVGFSKGDTDRLDIKLGGETLALTFDVCLLALGRVANTEDLGLEALGVRMRDDGTVVCNEFLQTDCPTIYACGDVAGPYQFTHVASHQAWYASVNSLFGMLKRFKADYSVIPWATFTDPEVARVGISEAEAKSQDVEYEVTTYGIDDLDRAIADGEDHGFVKVLTQPGKDRILGVTIVGYHASELIAEYVMAMKHGLGLNKILSTIHIYPTLSEANKFAAGEWKKARKPEKLLRWVQRFHDWRR